MNPRAWTDVSRTGDCMVALGNFDGVHLGHRRILETLLRESRASGLSPVIVTFEPHPRYFFKPGEKPSLLSTPAEKLALLAEWPVEVIPLAFDAGLAGLPAEAFVADFLKARLHGRRFLLGHDHRFGKGAMGDATLVQRHVADPVRDVLIVEPFRIGGETVSSSAIRIHLEAARIDQANRLLGRPFSYSGTVVRGDGRGRTLGYPTANIEVGYPWKAQAAFGVYGGKATVQGRDYPAIANLGRHPTFGGETVKIEVHLLDFQGDLYDGQLTFKLECAVRPEKKFPSAEALRAQIGQDIEYVRNRP